MKKYGKSRSELFEVLDRPALQSLPRGRFECFEWKAARANIDYHIEVDGHYYSVPHSLVGEVVEARYTASTVEVFLRRRRVASHARSYARGGFTTVTEHMPRAHREALEWSYPQNWTCVQSVCVHGGCTIDADCVIPGFECLAVDGVNRCVAPCVTDSECKDLYIMSGTRCIGESASADFCIEEITPP